MAGRSQDILQTQSGNNASPWNPVCSGGPWRVFSLGKNHIYSTQQAPIPPNGLVSAQDLLQEFDCLATEAG